MPIATTSRMAYEGILPELADRQRMVLDYLREHDNDQGWTNSEMAFFLMMPINSVTPRVNELRQMGMVVFAIQRKCTQTGFTAKAWRAVPRDGQLRFA